MELEFRDEDSLGIIINRCENYKHVQQVSFSTYHHALTQVCFTCAIVRTSIKEEDLE